MIAALMNPDLATFLYVAGLVLGIVVLVMAAMARNLPLGLIALSAVCLGLPLAWNALAT